MAAICDMCSMPANHEDVFFDVSFSTTGLDVDREDRVVCTACIMNYINSKTFGKINLIRRIESPYYAR